MIKRHFFKIFLLVFFFALQNTFANSLSAYDRLTPYEIHHYKFIGEKELYERLKQGQDLVLVDVRSAYAYQMEHIPGAISMPLVTFRQMVLNQPLPRTGIIVLYCSCPRHEAEMADDILKALGYHNAFVLKEGLPGWKSLGYKTVGTLANEPVVPYWVIGYAFNSKGKPQANVEVEVVQPQTQQLEIGSTDKNGFYALRVLFYGLTPGQQMQVVIGRDVVFYSLGEKTTPWGVRIDDHDGRMLILPKLFLKTFKEKKLM
jgi:rhodanese-related sulfurtransferase